MGKKITLLCSVLLIAGFFFFFVFYSGSPKEPGVLAPGALAKETAEGLKLQQENLQTADDVSSVRLCFRGEELACDLTEAAFYLPVDMDRTDWEEGSFSSADGDIRVYPLEDYTLLDKQTVVAEGERIPFLALNEKEDTITEFFVVFTGLPVVRMETDADLTVDTVFAGSVVFYEDCGQADWTKSSVFEAHERGQTTRAYPKKGYRVDLVSVRSNGSTNPNAQSVLGMRTSDSWIFYAIYSDGTKIRDKFNTELWNLFGASDTPYEAHFGTHMEYAELIVNGEYRGLYGVMEPIDTDQLQMSDQEYLYKRTYGRELTTELLDEGTPEEYLTLVGMELKGRDGAGSTADWQCFREFVELCESGDAEFSAGASALLNMENMSDLWIYLQMVYGEDNIYKNMFFAFKKETDGYRLYLVPWDMDLTWGNIYSETEELYVTKAPERAKEYLAWPFADRLLSLDVGGLKELVAERWEELRGGVLSDESMEALMESCIHQVEDSGALTRDAARWPESSHDADYASMRAFMETRLETMDEKIKTLDEWMKE